MVFQICLSNSTRSARYIEAAAKRAEMESSRVFDNLQLDSTRAAMAADAAAEKAGGGDVNAHSHHAFVSLVSHAGLNRGVHVVTDVYT